MEEEWYQTRYSLFRFNKLRKQNNQFFPFLSLLSRDLRCVFLLKEKVRCKQKV